MQLLHFALEGWHSQEPVPFYQAPNSLLGALDNWPDDHVRPPDPSPSFACLPAI